MERQEWLKKMRAQAEALYDHGAPLYWRTFGMRPNETHRRFIETFLGRLTAHSTLLDAGCGAGRYDGLLLEAGHNVLGIDQSGGMLARAREIFPEERFPALRYAKIGLQEMDFEAEFDGAICVDAMEHISPEDWPGILVRFQKALRPGGVLYSTVDAPDWDAVRESYERARAMGLPVVFGEVVDRLDTAYPQVMALDWQAISGELSDPAVYHYHPALEQVRAWLDQAGLSIEEEGTGDEYAHFLVSKKA
jgi:SAM-dependent methyltransferase